MSEGAPQVTRPAKVGPFTLVRPVARGGMGEVWQGVHAATGLPVAVKVMLGRRIAAGTTELLREARLLARLDHPHVATVLDAGLVGEDAAASTGVLTAGSPWLAMEWIGGGALDSLPRPRSWAGVAAITAPLLSALGHAHARGILHRDLKPSNVLMLDAPGDRAVRFPVLTDFGVSVALAADASAFTTSGTPEFMAPEQWVGPEKGEIGPWTDLYGLGCLLYWLVCGRPPYVGGLGELYQQHRVGAVPPLQPTMPVPEGLQELMATMLAKSPHDRFARAADVQAAIARMPLLRLEGPASPSPFASITVTMDAFDASRPTLDLEPPREVVRPPVTSAAPASAPVPASWRSVASRANPAVKGAGAGLRAFRLPPTVARDAERDQLWAALVTAAATGQTQVCRVGGPVGSGRSHLVRWLGERAAETGAAEVVDVGRGDSAWARGLARVVGPTPEAAPEWRRRLRSRYGAVGARIADWTLQPPDDPLAIVLEALTVLCRSRPVVVLVDDPADPLLDRLREQPIPAVIAVRGPPEGADILLGPLDAATMARLARESLGLDIAASLALADRSRGLPGVASELVEAWLQKGRLSAGRRGFSLVEPASPMQGTTERLARLRAVHPRDDAPAWRRWRSIQAIRACARALGTDPLDPQAVAELREAQNLASDLGQVDELYAEVEEVVALAERRGLQARVAPLRSALADEARRRGDRTRAERHWRAVIALEGAGAADGDVGMAMRALGRLLSERGERDAAIELGERAVQLTAGASAHARFAARCELAASCEQAGRFADATRWFEDAIAQLPAGHPASGAALNGLGEVARRSGDLEAAVGWYRGAIALFEAHRSIQAGVSHTNLGLVELARDDLPAAEAHATQAERLLSGSMASAVVGGARLVLAVVTARQSRWAEHEVHADHALGLLERDGYVDAELGRHAAACAQLARATGRVGVADRWAAYAEWVEGKVG